MSSCGNLLGSDESMINGNFDSGGKVPFADYSLVKRTKK
jgi:hypothetical protein